MSLRDDIRTVYDENGKLTPGLVVDAARPEDSSLHPRFEWDDTVAGEQWRHEQARQMIRQVGIVYRRETTHERVQVREWHAVLGAQGHVYEPLDKIEQDPFLQKMVLDNAEREWKDLLSRFSHLQEWMQMVRGDIEKAS